MTTKTFAVLAVRLKGFIEPDTRSQFEGDLPAGRYLVLDYLRDHPSPETDYARVLAPGLGANDTWICTRWRSRNYAVIEEREWPEEPLEDVDDTDAVPEERIVSTLTAFHDFTYDLDDARYPFELPGVRLPLAPPRTNNCCTFVEALIVRVWADFHTGFTWSPERHRQMMILSNDDYFSPVTALTESGIATPVLDPDGRPRPWTVIQGWRRQWREGHTLIVVAHHRATDRVLTLESNSAHRLDGVGFRGIGNLRDVGGQPPARWWERDSLWTWERLCSTYRYREQARLNVIPGAWGDVQRQE